MFTGIVEEVGCIQHLDKVSSHRPAGIGSGQSARLQIQANTVLEDAKIGDSIAVNGVCLTVIDLTPSFVADVSAETLRSTNLGCLTAGSPVNLERSVRLSDRLGGHLVQGHVDETATITGWWDEGVSSIMRVSISDQAGRYIVYKGSVTVDGVSLTVSKREDNAFEVALIPHTKQVTTLGRKKVGDLVNVEVDLIGRYVEQLLLSDHANSDISLDFLQTNGYAD